MYRSATVVCFRSLIYLDKTQSNDTFCKKGKKILDVLMCCIRQPWTEKASWEIAICRLRVCRSQKNIYVHRFGHIRPFYTHICIYYVSVDLFDVPIRILFEKSVRTFRVKCLLPNRLFRLPLIRIALNPVKIDKGKFKDLCTRKESSYSQTISETVLNLRQHSNFHTTEP